MKTYKEFKEINKTMLRKIKALSQNPTPESPKTLASTTNLVQEMMKVELLDQTKEFLTDLVIDLLDEIDADDSDMGRCLDEAFKEVDSES